MQPVVKYVVQSGKCDTAVNCAWCKQVRDRVSGEPLAEPLQTELKKAIESHGICEPCGSALKASAHSSRKFLVESLIEELQE